MPAQLFVNCQLALAMSLGLTSAVLTRDWRLVRKMMDLHRPLLENRVRNAKRTGKWTIALVLVPRCDLLAVTLSNRT